MPTELLVSAAVLFVVDVLLREWRPLQPALLRNLPYLLLAYGPMLTVPYLGPALMTAVACGVAIASLYSFARMVGLTTFPRFFLPTLVLTAAFFAVARMHWYGLFQAMPAFAIFGIVAAGATRGETDAFLQKLCLAWLCVLVYGYLFAHAALFVDSDLKAVYPGQLWVSVIILIGKFADVSWVATKGLASTRPWIQLLVAPAGGVLGAFAIGPELPGFMTPTQFALFGLIIGIALAFGSRAYDLVVLDVIGHNPRGPNQPLKGTMVFGFAFSLALAYHFVRYVS